MAAQRSSLGIGPQSPFEDPERPLAFLVDGDNASAHLIGQVLEETSKYGLAIIRRVYGDWTSPNLAPWKLVLQRHALSPSQQFAYAAGKNATDSSLIVEAMDILHGGKVGGFCIVSSDSDYTRLAMRIREEGMFVMGVGRADTPVAFQSACNVFVTIENISGAGPGTNSGGLPQPPSKDQRTVGGPVAGSAVSRATSTPVPRTPPSESSNLLHRAFETVVREDGRAHLGALGAALQKLDPAFDPRTYGCPNLVTLVRKLPEEFELERPDDLADPRIYVRLQSNLASPAESSR